MAVKSFEPSPTSLRTERAIGESGGACQSIESVFKLVCALVIDILHLPAVPGLKHPYCGISCRVKSLL